TLRRARGPHLRHGVGQPLRARPLDDRGRLLPARCPMIRMGTRGSALARAQSQQLADQLTARTGARVELVAISTFGDKSAAPLTEIGGVGVFVAAVREAVVAGEVDFAV